MKGWKPFGSDRKRKPQVPGTVQPTGDPPGSPLGDLLEMHGRYGLLLRFVFRRFFAPFRFSEAQAETIRSLAGKGQIVYVMQHASVLMYVFLNFWLWRYRLPLAVYGNGVTAFFLFQPFGKVLRIALRTASFLRKRGRGALFASRFREHLQNRRPIVLFLRAPRFSRLRTQVQSREVLEALLALQGPTPHPVFLVPIGILWGKRPEKINRSFLDLLLGHPESPGLLRQIFSFTRYSRHSVVATGKVIDLGEFLNANQHLEPDLLAKKVKWALYRELDLARQEITGPKLKPRKYMIESILSHPPLRALARETARSEGKSFEKVMKKAARYAEEIAADYDIAYVHFLDRVLTWAWHNIYSGFHVDQEGLQRVKECARKGALVLLPSHKSHVDYLVLSYVFYHNDLPPPHIAAGVNLSFWPLGHVFRKAGAFFLRRTIRGQKLYEAVFRTYVKKLLREGYVQEFFPEGTRSRTGKLLRPRLGMLSMEIDAYADGACEDLFLVPIAITYDRLVEEASHTREIGGAKKEKEKFTDLLRMPKFLTRKYGRVYIQFARPLSLREYLKTRKLELAPMEPSRRRAIIEDLGMRIGHAINEVTTVTPGALAATVLLNHLKRGISLGDFLLRASFLLGLIEGTGTRTTASLRNLARAMQEALDRFVEDRVLEKWEDPEGTLYTLDSAKRMHLDYYKNSILHFFLPFAMAACAFRLHGRNTLTEQELLECFRFLQELFEKEFIFPPEDPVGRFWTRAREELCVRREVMKLGPDGKILAEAKGQLAYLARLLDNYFESYHVIFRTAELHLQDKGLDEREFIKRALVASDRLYRRGDLQRRESRSVFVFRNALDFLVLKGCVRSVPAGGGMELRMETAGREAMESYRRRLLSLLPKGLVADDW